MEKQKTEVVASTFTEFIYDSAKSAYRALAWMYAFLADRGEKVPKVLDIMASGRYRLEMYRDFRNGKAEFRMFCNNATAFTWSGNLDREGLSFLHLLAEREVR